MSRIQLFNHFGTKVAELKANADRTWKLSDYGRCIFEIPIIHPKCKEEYLQFGNFVYIEHSKLPPWGGVIDTPREWNRNTVAITAYSSEYIFKFRRSVSIQTLRLDPSAIFSQIVDSANSEGDTRIQKNSIVSGGEVVKWELNILKYYDEVKRLASETENEFHLIPQVTGGQIWFLADWSDHIGVVRNYQLKEGLNIEATNNVIVEDGTIVNDMLGIGYGLTQESKKNHVITDEDSHGKYGLRQDSKTFQQDEYSSIEAGTQAALNESKNPSKTFGLSALDKGETWRNIDIGDTLALRMAYSGFMDNGIGMETDVRITGMTYVESDNKLELVCEETT
jgi:hypothetical protein